MRESHDLHTHLKHDKDLIITLKNFYDHITREGERGSGLPLHLLYQLLNNGMSIRGKKSTPHFWVNESSG